MLRLDIYYYGSGVRVRSHHHAAGADEACNPECEERSLQRCYSEHGESPADTRKRIATAASRAVMASTTGHRQFLLEMGVQDALPGL